MSIVYVVNEFLYWIKFCSMVDTKIQRYHQDPECHVIFYVEHFIFVHVNKTKFLKMHCWNNFDIIFFTESDTRFSSEEKFFFFFEFWFSNSSVFRIICVSKTFRLLITIIWYFAFLVMTLEKLLWTWDLVDLEPLAKQKDWWTRNSSTQDFLPLFPFAHV